MKILITGANGYIGSALTRALGESHEITGLVRHLSDTKHSYQVIGDICGINAEDVSGFDCVVHTAAVAETTANQAELQRVNVEGAKCIARACHDAGVKRLINLSSVKAAGEGNVGCLVPDQPTSAYGLSKLQAEKEINAVLEGSKTRVVHLRFPLVYGVDIQNNFKKLIDICRSPVPLPFASLTASRSYCFVGNLIQLIEQELMAPESDLVVYVADPGPMTLPALLAELSSLQGYKMRLMRFPEALLEIGVRLAKPSYAKQLFGNAVVDVSATQRSFKDWQPISTVDALRYLEIGRDGRI